MINFKSMAKTIGAVAVGGLMLLSAPQAQALMIGGSYAVNVNSGSGLQIETRDILSNPFALDLSVGVAQSVNLFRIWTNETSVNPGEDNVPRAASVDWTFTAPLGSQSSVGASNGGYALFVFQYGEINWDNPTVVNFDNGAMLEINLSNERFNEGLFGLNEGRKNGAKVKATFLLTRDGGSGGSVSVPEPASLALLSTGLLGMGLLIRRRRRQK